MKWYSMDEYIPPREVICLLFTKNNYFYTGLWSLRFTKDGKIDGHEWADESECGSCGHFGHPLNEVTHFALIPPVKKGLRLNKKGSEKY
jgi:hypothetical protein